MSTYTEQRRAKLADILGDRSTPREERIARVSRFVEEEVRGAFVRGVRQSRTVPRKPRPVSAGLVRDDVDVDDVQEDEL